MVVRNKMRLTKKQIFLITRKILELYNIPLICINCGTIEKIHIHHIDGNRLNNKLSNLKVLCNSCHNKEHNWNRCPVCNQLKPSKNHTCPTTEDYKKSNKNNIKNRERCKICGKVFGKDKNKHSCKHPKGMLGKHHSKETKKRIAESIKFKNT